MFVLFNFHLVQLEKKLVAISKFFFLKGGEGGGKEKLSLVKNQNLCLLPRILYIY